MPDSTNPITSALEVLQQQIGHEPFYGTRANYTGSYDPETIITQSNKQSCISWLVLQGFSKRNVQKNSLAVLGKLYGIESYFKSALRQQGGIPSSHINTDDVFNTPTSDVITDELTTWEAEKEIDERENTQNLNTKKIELLIKKILLKDLVQQRGEILEELGEKNLNLHKKIIEAVEQKIKSDFTTEYKTLLDTIKNETQKQSQHQQEELKKIVEDIIFKGYLNQKLQNPSNIIQNNTSQDNIKDILPQTNSEFLPKIDPNYHFDPYATKVIRSALSMCENLYVYGDTGCGKTTHLEQVCAVMSRGIVRVNPHDGITREMFLGGMKLINNETVFVEGALPIAMRNGYIFLVDEISFLPPNLTAILNPIGEKGGKLYIPETSEWITPQPGFCIFATDNTGGKGDRTGQYTGTEVQNTATLDRFAFCIKMDYLPQEKEYEMLIKRFPNQNQDEIKGMLDLAKDIRSAFSRGELSITLSTRKLIKYFDQRENNFTTIEALQNTLLSWLDEDDEILVKTMIDRLQITNGVV